ncbi:hypothetical protein M0813_22838 [Anaeramoeba flamelloides]|uniref:RING-type domain-containing protein n=1 Tax=Anaeramoeba flamelloides TaxID=1746091 RepID=A0ABQ8YBX7_9EUKA|nr:hypothetical protein M0813_22838 [Anaeramoeba flamelloides]
MQNNTTQQNCCICLEKIKVRGRTSCCEHNFCFDCILKWSKIENVCPICRKSFINLYKTKRPFSFNCKIVETINVSPKKQSVKLTEEESIGSFIESDPSDDDDDKEYSDDDYGIDLGISINTYITVDNQQGRCRRSSRLANIEKKKQRKLEKVNKNLFNVEKQCEKKQIEPPTSQILLDKFIQKPNHSNLNKKKKEKNKQKKKRKSHNDLNFFIPHIHFEDEKSNSSYRNKKKSSILNQKNERVTQLNYLIIEKKRKKKPLLKNYSQNHQLFYTFKRDKNNTNPLRNLTNQRKRKLDILSQNKDKVARRRDGDSIGCSRTGRKPTDKNTNKNQIKNKLQKKKQPIKKRHLKNSNSYQQFFNFKNQNRIFTKRKSLNFIITTKQNSQPPSFKSYLTPHKKKKIRSLGLFHPFNLKK